MSSRPLRFDNVMQVVGNTPLVRLDHVAGHTKATIWAKLEYMNPGGSVKDRAAMQIIEDAEREGALKPGGTIVEATSGNTGVGLALCAALKGYKCVFVMPDKMSDEKIRTLRAFGAKVVITPTNVMPEDPRSYYSVSRRIAEETPNSFYANQYHNQSNPLAHYKTTGPEIWEQMEGEVDAFVATMGTGGTISGTGRYLKEQKADVQIVGVDPVGSLYYDYFKTGKLTEAYSYKVEGFGEDFLPSAMHFEFVDEVVRVTDKECFTMTRRLVREEGIYAGGSSGGAVAAAVKYAEKMNRPMNIVVLLPDSAAKYLSKVFNDDWMRENGFMGDESKGTVADLLAQKGGPRELLTATLETTIREVVSVMKREGVSQLPVLVGGRVSGVVNESDVLEYVLTASPDPGSAIASLVKSTFALVEPANNVAMVGQLFGQGKVVMVVEQGRLLGIITKIDYIDYVSRVM